MACFPTAIDVFDYLEGYCINTTQDVNIETFTGSAATDILTVSGSYRYADGQMLQFSTSTTLPSPIVINQKYYAIYVSDTEIKVANSYADALAGTNIDITVDGSGTVTAQDYLFISLEWLQNRMTKLIIPIVERIIRKSLSTVEEITEFYSGTGRSILILNRKDIIDIVRIEVLNNDLIENVINLSNIYVIAGQGILKARRAEENLYNLFPTFPKGQRNIRITYTAGYGGELPNDLCEAIVLLTAEWVLGFIGSRTGGGPSFGVQAYNRTFGDRGKFTDIRREFARMAWAILNKYKTGVVGQ